MSVGGNVNQNKFSKSDEGKRKTKKYFDGKMHKTVCLSAVGKVVQDSQMTQVSNLKTKFLVAAKCH